MHLVNYRSFTHSVLVGWLACFSRLLAFQHSGEKEWAVIFDLLKRNASNPQLCQEMKKLLQKKKIGNADNYMEVAVLGFACTCFSPLRPSSPKYNRTVSKGGGGLGAIL